MEEVILLLYCDRLFLLWIPWGEQIISSYFSKTAPFKIGDFAIPFLLEMLTQPTLLNQRPWRWPVVQENSGGASVEGSLPPWHLWHAGHVLLYNQLFVHLLQGKWSCGMFCFCCFLVCVFFCFNRYFPDDSSETSYLSSAPPGALLWTPERWRTKASGWPGLGNVHSKTPLLCSPWENERLPDRKQEKESSVPFLSS